MWYLEPGTPYKWLCLRTSVFRWNLHLNDALFMDAVNKLHPSVWQTQFAGDWYEEVGGAPLNPDIVWTDEVEQRGDFSNFDIPFYEPREVPEGAGIVVDEGMSLTIETIDPCRGLNHIRMVIDGSAPLDPSDTIPPLSKHHCIAYKIWEYWFPVLYARTDIKIVEHSGFNGPLGVFGLMGIKSGNCMNYITLASDGRLRQVWRDDSGVYTKESSTQLTPDGNYHGLEISYKVGNGDGEARVWLDKKEVMDLQHLGLINTVVGGSTGIQVGQDEMFYFTAGKATIDYDRVIAATSYIGLETATVPQSWYDFYLPSMVNLTKWCHRENIICQILFGNMENLAGVELGPGFQWYIDSFYQELARQGVAPPEWFGLDLEWVKITASTTEEYRQALEVIKAIVEGYGSRFMLVYAVSGRIQDPLRAVYPWVGNAYYPVEGFYPTTCATGPLDLSDYEQYVKQNGWDQQCLGLMTGILHVEAYPCWTEQNIVSMFDGFQPTLFGVLAIDTVSNMLDPAVCPDFARVVSREAHSRGYILNTTPISPMLNLIDPLYIFGDPDISQVAAKFREAHAVCESFYGGGGYWMGSSFQARYSGRIAIGYMRYIRTTGDKGLNGVYELRVLEALEFLLAGQGKNGPQGYWDDVGYETGIGMRTMCEAWLLYGDPRYLQSAVAAGDAVIRENLNLSGNYGAFCVWGLPLLYSITGDVRYLNKAVEIAQRDAALMNAAGYWPGDHLGRISYHEIYLRGWIALLKVIPVNHAFTPTLVDAINRAGSWTISQQASGGAFWGYPDHHVDDATDNAGLCIQREPYMRAIETFGEVDKTFGVSKVRYLINGLVIYNLAFTMPSGTGEADYTAKIHMILVTGSAIEYYQAIPPPPQDQLVEIYKGKEIWYSSANLYYYVKGYAQTFKMLEDARSFVDGLPPTPISPLWLGLASIFFGSVILIKYQA